MDTEKQEEMRHSMTLAEYQTAQQSTAIYPKHHGLDYCILNLASEAGELAGQRAKALRDDSGMLTGPRREAMLKELGDCLWMVSALSYELDSSLEEVAEINLIKLGSRKERGVLGGSGDER
jgi:NTP pyrophosphatase (non-canonical NTP hydrolase)